MTGTAWAGEVGAPYRRILERVRTLGAWETIVINASPPPDTPIVGEGWPSDGLHDAAKQVVTGADKLVPDARKAVAKAVDKAGAAPTGRSASDGALGRAIGSRFQTVGLVSGWRS